MTRFALVLSLAALHASLSSLPTCLALIANHQGNPRYEACASDVGMCPIQCVKGAKPMKVFAHIPGF